MKHSIRLFVWTLVVVLAATPAMAGSINGFVGFRQVDTGESDADEIEDQFPALGATFDFNTGGLPFDWFAGVYGSGKEEDESLGGGVEVTLTAVLLEGSFGLGKTWDVGGARPFVHGGLSLQSLFLEADFSSGPFNDADDSDISPGLYGEGGVWWRVGDSFNVGAAGRILMGTDYDVEDFDLEADYIQIGAILGWGYDG